MIANDMFLLIHKKKKPIEGIADLHTHPAVHLAFGGPEDGSGQGLFWGRPFNANGQDISIDIPACIADKHSGFTGDLVQHRTRLGIVKSLDALALNSFQHTSNGPPTCQSWPHALSVTHQQMHIDWIRRAWKGGLRLMVASTIDAQAFAMLWYQNSGGAAGPQPDFDRLSTECQLNAIRQMVNLNADWMQIVKTSTEAKEAIQAGKLAVILGVEMDQLTVDDMLQLWDSHDLRFVTPIHLVNNTFGGAAIYEASFNTANQWLNGSFFDVKEDNALEFRFSEEQMEIRFPEPGEKPSVYPPCSKSSASPSTYSNGNMLAIAWKGTQTPGRLRWVRRTDAGWKKSLIDDGQGRKSNHSPSIAFFNNRWYAAWTGTNANHPYIHIMRSLDATGDTWGSHYKLDGSSGRPKAKSRCNPFLLSANGRLSLFWVGTNSPGKIRWTSTTNGTRWSQKLEINDGKIRKSNYAPTAAFFNNRYYVAWTGTNTAHPYIHLLISTDAHGAMWVSHSKFDGNGRPKAKSSQSPMLLAANGKIHLIWTGTNKGKIRWTQSSNGTSWQEKSIIQDWRERRTHHAPSLAFHNNRYYVAWTGMSTTHPYIHSLKSIDVTASRWIHHSKNIGCPGHRNVLGLTSQQDILKLMKKGFIIDIAHMSQKAVESMLDLAEQYKYPLVSSHTGVHPVTGLAISERDMTREHAARLSKLGGVIGFGTGWNKDIDEQITDWISKYQDLLSILGYSPTLGTDFNGLSPKIPKSEQPVQYPFTGFNNERFKQLKFGQRKFNFGNDGLATYGMLPDFINAVSSKDPDTQKQLLSSVQVIVDMWYRMESAQKNIEI